MVKVAELIADTIWTPGSAYQDNAPELSIFLPTFRRGADGLLQRAIDSIRGQTFRDFELIIIDDASTDGSADVIRRAMAEDGRISCLTHPRNVGLPAASEFEAYLRSRGRFIGFAFDDFIFEPNAYHALVGAARAHPDALVHGYVEMSAWSGNPLILGQAPIPYGKLAQGNFIANASVLMPRALIEDVGFFDPHILAARECDWDLWRRTQRQYPIIRIPALIGQEHGTVRADSLGHTYPVFQEITEEFYGGRPNRELVPANLPDRDVWAVPPSASAALGAATIATRGFFKSKAWAVGLPIDDLAEVNDLIVPKRPVIGIFGSVDASVDLCFAGLRPQYGPSLRLIVPDTALVRQMRLALACDAMIFVRALLEPHSQYMIQACRAADIDLHYLADDNPIELRRENRHFTKYTVDSVRDALSVFKTAMATSPALVQYFNANELHHNVRLFGPILAQDTLGKMARILPQAHPNRLRVGFIGGDFRRADLQANVYPALVTAAHHGVLEFVTRESATSKLRFPDPPVVSHPVRFVASYDDFLQEWRGLGIDILVHPKGISSNIAYKTDSVLLTALYLGAVPLVADEPAFAGIGESQGVIKVGGSPSEWSTAIERVQDSAYRDELLKRLKIFCLSHFDPALNASVIEAILTSTRAAGVGDQFRRFSVMINKMGARLVEADAQLGSRAFQLAVRIRSVANLARRAAGWVRRR